MATARAMRFESIPATPILVEMEVTRMIRRPREKCAQIWGYVGDYEVSVTLPSSDGRVRALAELHKTAAKMCEGASEG